jgi:hypothetical protein
MMRVRVVGCSLRVTGLCSHGLLGRVSLLCSSTPHASIYQHSHHFKQRVFIADFCLTCDTCRQNCSMSDAAEMVERNGAGAHEMQTVDLSGRQVLMKGTALKEVGVLSRISPSHRLFLHCTHQIIPPRTRRRVVLLSIGPLSWHVRQRG